MKNLKFTLFTIGLLSALLFNPHIAKAQAWQKNSKVLSLGIGASEFFHIDNLYYGGGPNHPRGWYSPFTGQINFQGDFGVGKYVGLGFTTGIGGRGGLLYGYGGEFNIPIGLVVNFHFYQLIADKTKNNISADKVDVYAGVNLGSGIAATYFSDGVTRLVPIAFGGFQLGVRYYFAPRVGLNAELGWGKSIINIGFSFKLENSKK